MKKQNLNSIEKETEKMYERRERRKKKRMKVTGAGVKGLQRIIMRKQKV